jgi:hypothetical protein
LIARSFDLCGITSNHALYDILNKILACDEDMSDYVIDELEHQEVGLDYDDLFDERLVPEGTPINASKTLEKFFQLNPFDLARKQLQIM